MERKKEAIDHTTFGGYVFLSDFNTDYRGKRPQNESVIARRIMADMNFDRQCRKAKGEEKDGKTTIFS